MKKSRGPLPINYKTPGWLDEIMDACASERAEKVVHCVCRGRGACPVCHGERTIAELEAKNKTLQKRSINAELLALAEAVAAHFEGTDAPLGHQARSAIEKAKS